MIKTSRKREVLIIPNSRRGVVCSKRKGVAACRRHTFLKKVDENFPAIILIKNASRRGLHFYYKLIIKSPIKVIAIET